MSFTLSKSVTETKIEFDLDPKRKGLEIDFSFDGEKALNFETKIKSFLGKNPNDFPYLDHLKLSIGSSNTFPHSAGIASSASSMSALALCLVSMETRAFGAFENKAHFRNRASHIARLASGSASRSVYGGLVCWGETESVRDSSDLYGVPINEGIDDVFNTFQDAILIVDSGKKKVSSTLGHKMMVNHPYAEMRYYVARTHVEALGEIMQGGDVKAFGRILENEALALHGLMMNSEPSFVLLKPNTLKIIELVREIRESEDLPWYFTLDAGPNVHLMYPLSEANRAEKLIKEVLLPYTEDNQVIYDHVGKGPEKVD